MPPAIELLYKRRPVDIMTYLLGLLGASNHFDPKDPFLRISAKWEKIKIDKSHLHRFNKLCRITCHDNLSLLYPFTLVYPVFQRILGHRKAPLSMFRVLNTRMQVLQHRKIDIKENLSIECNLTGYRVLAKGLEIYISSAVKSDGETVWENIQTFYYRGSFGEADDSYTPPFFKPILDASIIDKWFLPQNTGRKFARFSGDGNPIHTSKIWARKSGFKRDFAQPMFLLANSLERQQNVKSEYKIYLDVVLKGQIYYEHQVVVKGISGRSNTRFDLYCQENNRPCISGNIEFQKQNKTLSDLIMAA